MADLTLEDLLSRFAGACESERGSQWTAGDIVAHALETLTRTSESPRELRRRRRKLLGQFASVGHCTVAWVAQHAAVSATFGTERRLPDVPFSFYRAVVNAAYRCQLDAQDVFDDAIATGKTVADLNAMGKEVPQAVELATTCTQCGTAVRLRNEGTTAHAFKGLPISCPVCVARFHHEGTDGKEAPGLGVLEAG
jgi:hypothetical protein